jgi:hypothetical protein
LQSTGFLDNHGIGDALKIKREDALNCEVVSEGGKIIAKVKKE